MIHAQTQLLAFPGGRYGRCSAFELLKLQSSPKILGRLLSFTLEGGGGGGGVVKQQTKV